MKDRKEQLDFQTRAVRAGQRRGPEGEHSDALFLTSSYVFDNAAQAAARFAGDEEGNVYSRYTNPTVRAFETRIASLEGADAAVATSSGMAAILSLCMGLLKAGDHVICSRDVFGATLALFDKHLSRFGIEVTFVPLADLDQWKAAVVERTRLLFIETPSNPLCEVGDIAALADIARGAGARLVVDNCFCTPALQRPLEFGADLVMHSATKFLDGQGRCLGGVVLGDSETIAEIRSFVRSAGPSMSPFNAWVFHTGIETLEPRVRAQSQNALELAQWLEARPEVERVLYAGLPEHPGHALAKRQHSGGFGSVLSFRIGGDRRRAWKFLDAVELLSLTANLGDVKSTIVHPATTTHGRMDEDLRREVGISDDLIRIAAGLESQKDLRMDLDRAFKALD